VPPLFFFLAMTYSPEGAGREVEGIAFYYFWRPIYWLEKAGRKTEIGLKKVDFFFAEASAKLFFSPVFYAPSNFHARSIRFFCQF